MAYNRYLKRERHRRQYTFTKTKAAVGFLLSALFSISLNSYFDRYGPVIIDNTKTAVASVFEGLKSDKKLLPKEVQAYELRQR